MIAEASYKMRGSFNRRQAVPTYVPEKHPGGSAVVPGDSVEVTTDPGLLFGSLVTASDAQ
ncbi:hypothetical protein GCM10022206_54510 [Streptomyces chiangmaiensis]